MNKDEHESETKNATKTDLLKFTYDEVLDATKHQDEKIGRFLTAIAFLTATSFAMAGLSQGRFIFQTFKLGSQSPVHFGMYALAVFLLGVVATVLVLMTSFATQLRFPNIEAPSDNTSIVYFAEISHNPLTDWINRWEDGPKLLSDSRDAHFIKEIHNLSIRAKTKYDRLREAASVFSLAMLAYAISIVFVVLAATRTEPSNLSGEEIPAINIDFRVRFAVWIVFMVFMLIQFYSGYQALNHDIEKLETNWETNQLSRWIYLTLMVSISALSLATGEGIEKTYLILVLMASLITYCALTYILKKKTGVIGENREVVWIGIQFAICGALILILSHSDTYILQFIYSFILIAAIVSRSGLDALVRTRRQQRKVAQKIKKKTG